MPWMDRCGALNQQAVCDTQNGVPSNPFIQRGEVAPEGEVVGHAVGNHQYWDTVAEKMYIFNGVVGTSTGWVALN